MPGMNANLPVKWLSDGTIHGLSLLAWWLHSFGIAWSMQHESDGVIPVNALPVIEPYRTRPVARSNALRELVESGLWRDTDDGYLIENWSGSQTTREQMDKKRAKWRRDKENEHAGLQPTVPDSTRGSTDGSAVDPQQSSKEGQGTANEGSEATAKVGLMTEHDEAFASDPGLRFLDADEQTREVRVWRSAIPGRPGEWDDPEICPHDVMVGSRCSECGGLAAPRSVA